ncbi:hypothetical protein GCM10011396_49070 [Undibacterium terreum]|uniref:Tetratricopeptide repeat-containing protein n=1 Tax=Undibacterium terreum TaxID=1224302 RepID=A0A916XS65_9BURK|nr:hypothetical protein GCM10011396_49070 [Undibacterium terreum]
MNDEATALYQDGRYDQATALAKKSLQLAQSDNTPNNPDVATSLSKLAAIYAAQGFFEQAEPLSRQALAIRVKKLNAEDPDIVANQAQLAGINAAILDRNRTIAPFKRISTAANSSSIFQILNKDAHSATFAFNGSEPNSRKRWRQVIEVDAKQGEDIDLAIVRRMIQIIRTYYTGDFNWESRRLGRTVSMSARPEDTAALEDFMMREFDFR